MNDLHLYNIPFVGLKDGVSEFNYSIDGSFFEHFPNSPISNCEVTVKLFFEKKPSLFILSFELDGTVNVECDRCLQRFDQPIFLNYNLYVKLKDNEIEKENEADVVYISRTETHLDIAPYIYDYINLSLPVRKVHPLNENGKEQCDPEIIKILNNKKEQKQPAVDPRWEALEKLKG